MKINTANLSALITDAGIRQNVASMLNAMPEVSSVGGMTLDMGDGPIVVCTGKPSLADEKSFRADIRKKLGNDKVKFSRTNDIGVRCSQYDIAENATEFKKMFGKAEPKAKAKTEGNTPVVATAPTVPANVPAVVK